MATQFGVEALPFKAAKQVTETTSESKFETRRWPYLVMMPFYFMLVLWISMKKAIAYRVKGAERLNYNSRILEDLCPTFRALRRMGGTWRALELLYDRHAERTPGFKGVLDRFWCGLMNAQAVRNRLVIVQEELAEAIRSLGRSDVRLMELASGSAVGALEVMRQLKNEGITVHALLTDTDQAALDYSLKLAEQYGLADQVEVAKLNALKMRPLARRFKPDVVEMVGLLDYFNRETALHLFQQIADCLPDGGLFLTGNVMPNIEAFVVHGAFEWPSMTYRRAPELADLLVEGGFTLVHGRVEPLRIHVVTVAAISKSVECESTMLRAVEAV